MAALPEQFREAYGKSAKLVILLPEQEKAKKKRRQPGSAKGRLRGLSEDKAHLVDFKDDLP